MSKDIRKFFLKLKIESCPNGAIAAHFATACAVTLSYVRLSTRLSVSVTSCVKLHHSPPLGALQLYNLSPRAIFVKSVNRLAAATVDEGVMCVSA